MRQALPHVVDTSSSPHARLRPVPLSDVTLADEFWAPRREVNRVRTLPSQYQHLEASGAVDNFRRAAGLADGLFAGMYFSDTDVYKWLEAASFHLAGEGDPALARLVDDLVEVVAAAQREDGYLNTYFARERSEERWTDFDLHEMYCAGHLFQAAVANWRASGASRLLAVATRFADHICERFGPGPGQVVAVDGHPEVELGLVELYRATRDGRYLEQARFFVEARGRGLLGRPYDRFGPEYSQDHAPFRDLGAVTGHAVRALYYNAGAADLYAELGERDYLVALERMWLNMTGRRMYVSGGLGSRYEGEAFGEDFELPHARAYTETCAAIASVMWNWRMLALEGDARYADLLEWTLFNAVLPGVSLAGEEYFYQNPLEDDGGHRRRPWFGCACCPPNVARLLASLPGYLYSVSEQRLWLHLYAAGSVATRLPGGRLVSLEQRADYPWSGAIELRLRSGGRFALMLRIPGWVGGEATAFVNGVAVDAPARPGSYLEIDREWREGDAVEVRLPMPPRRLGASRHVKEASGRLALARGPVLYCVEATDNPGIDLRDLRLDPGGKVETSLASSLPGITALRGAAYVDAPDIGVLYRTHDEERSAAAAASARPFEFTAVPYFAWANREPGRMQVWIRSPS